VGFYAAGMARFMSARVPSCLVEKAI